MTPATLKHARDLDFKIDRLAGFITTTKQMRSFCNGFGVSESPECTEQLKALLIADLEAQLAQLQAELASL